MIFLKLHGGTKQGGFLKHGGKLPRSSRSVETGPARRLWSLYQGRAFKASTVADSQHFLLLLFFFFFFTNSPFSVPSFQFQRSVSE
ncbi:hypothetical protein CDL15_Pgr015999 [Punica granatum]|uniref:Uncharacterized protein n=1 Tax=Punica granatum TaxID=22663 RepID=A0A218XPR6_PUNGR|nr:hypothetical protein CDL15_Pgr015999 [Punica granatum]